MEWVGGETSPDPTKPINLLFPDSKINLVKCVQHMIMMAKIIFEYDDGTDVLIRMLDATKPINLIF